MIGIWGFKKPSDRRFETGVFDLIDVLTGQHSAIVFEGGRIRLPYGSIGSAYVCEWRDDHFVTALDERRSQGYSEVLCL